MAVNFARLPDLVGKGDSGAGTPAPGPGFRLGSARPERVPALNA